MLLLTQVTAKNLKHTLMLLLTHLLLKFWSRHTHVIVSMIYCYKSEHASVAVNSISYLKCETHTGAAVNIKIYFGAVVLDHQYMAAHKISSYAYRLTNTQTSEYSIPAHMCNSDALFLTTPPPQNPTCS